jgi:hypothetical protein
MADEEHAGILKSIGEVLRADLGNLTKEPPPRALLLQVLHLVRREQERHKTLAQRVSQDELPEELRSLLEQLRSLPRQ